MAAHWSNLLIIGGFIVVGWNAKDFIRTLVKEVNSEQQKSLVVNDSIQASSQLITNLILKDLAKKVDSSLIYSRNAYSISKLNTKVNIEMSKQLKGFDILKFYDPFMLLNQKTERKIYIDTIKWSTSNKRYYFPNNTNCTYDTLKKKLNYRMTAQGS